MRKSAPSFPPVIFRIMRFLQTKLLACGLLAGVVLGVSAADLSTGLGSAVDLTAPHPQLACTPVELARLQSALMSTGAVHKPVAACICRADLALQRSLDFPPRGARHNQWYQCDACQTALKTLPDGAHQCPLCQKKYTGEPYDDVIFGRRHAANQRDLLDCAWAYALTGGNKYVEHARRILIGYAERYMNYPRRGTTAWHLPYNYVTGARLYDQTLSEASALVIFFAPAYDLISDADVLSPDDHRQIQERLIRPMLENIGRSWWNSGISNWQAWHNAAMFWGGVLLHDPAWIERSLNDPKNGFYFQMANAVTADGLWHEGSWGYHFYTLQALIWHAEGARRVGLDLWKTPALQAMFRLPFDCLMPDGQMPRFGDDVNSAPEKYPALIEAGKFNLPDLTALDAALPKQPVWETVLYGRTCGDLQTPMPSVDSRIFPAAGYVILRRGVTKGLAAGMTFGPYGGAHGHLDKLSFVFYGFGRELGVDPGRAASQAYRLPIHKHWYKATISHNTVTMKGRTQRPCAGELECFTNDAGYVAAVVSASPWPGVRHRRLLLLTDEYLLVADDLAARNQVRFDWLYHQRADALECVAAAVPTDPPSDIAGAEYFKNCRQGYTTNAVHVVFQDSEIETDLIMAGGADTRVLTGDGPGRSVTDRVPLIIAGRTGKSVWFAAVLSPARTGTPAGLQQVVADRVAAGRLRVRVMTVGGELTAVFGQRYLEVRVPLDGLGHKRRYRAIQGVANGAQ